MPNLGDTAPQVDRHNIEPAFALINLLFEEIPGRDFPDLIALPDCHGVFRLTEQLRIPGFDLNENKRTVFLRDNVDLPPFESVISFKNTIPFF